MFIGVIFNVVLYGVMFTQTYMYFNMYKEYVRVWLPVWSCALIEERTVTVGG